MIVTMDQSDRFEKNGKVVWMIPPTSICQNRNLIAYFTITSEHRYVGLRCCWNPYEKGIRE